MNSHSKFETNPKTSDKKFADTEADGNYIDISSMPKEFREALAVSEEE